MTTYGIITLLTYGSLLLVGQSVIAHKLGVTGMKGREVPGRYIMVVCSLIFLFAACVTMQEQEPVIIAMVIGVIVTLLGLALTLWAQWELGPNWVGGIGLRKKHRLVTTGPYRYVRHPLYSGMLVSALGLSIFGLNLWYSLCAFSFAASYVYRTMAEEQELRKKFRERYERYEKTTGMLIPRIRKRG